MDEELQAALEILIRLDDADGTFDREADEGGYRSEALDSELAVIRQHLLAHAPNEPGSQ